MYDLQVPSLHVTVVPVLESVPPPVFRIVNEAARLQATSQADYGPTSDNELAKALHSGRMQVVWDRPDNMTAREALFGRAAAILTGQAR